jgi:hypothetical protein
MAYRSSSKPKVEDDIFSVLPSIVFPPLFIRFNSDLTRSSSLDSYLRALHVSVIIQ